MGLVVTRAYAESHQGERRLKFLLLSPVCLPCEVSLCGPNHRAFLKQSHCSIREQGPGRVSDFSCPVCCRALCRFSCVCCAGAGELPAPRCVFRQEWGIQPGACGATHARLPGAWYHERPIHGSVTAARAPRGRGLVRHAGAGHGVEESG